MTAKTPPRLTLAHNLRTLMAARDVGTPEVSRVSGVDKKTINNLLHGRYDPRLDKIDAVARVFGLTAWQLIVPGMAESMIEDGKLQDVLDSYAMTDSAGRESIVRVAEMAARPYRK